jgi:hypothetical protein
VLAIALPERSISNHSNDLRADWQLACFFGSIRDSSRRGDLAWDPDREGIGPRAGTENAILTALCMGSKMMNLMYEFLNQQRNGDSMTTRLRIGSFCNDSMVAAFRRFILSGSLLLLLGSPARCEPKSAVAGSGNKPILTGAVSSIDQVYDDLKFVFELAGDKAGFKSFKDTIGVFTDGVQTDKPSGWRVYSTADGLGTVASVPVQDEAAFKKFLRNLWDLDVKTAPPPAPSLNSHVGRSVQEKVRSLKLQPNERILFGLTDGFLRYESGYVHIGESIEDVRLARGGIPAPGAKGTVALSIDGESSTPAQRREAFEKSKQNWLADLKKTDSQTDAQFALAKAIVELQLDKFELFFSETSQVELGWTTSHESRKSEMTARVTAAKGTSLAKDFEQMGNISDEFAGVSKSGAVMSSTINFPNDQGLTKALKSVTHDARDVVGDQIDRDERLNAEQKSVDRQLLDLVCDLVDNVAGMPVFNGFARTWANSDGTLTTVGALKVSDGTKYREAVQKFKSQERVGGKSADGGIEIHKISVATWQKDFPELFEKDGAVYLGTSDKTFWYALGEKAHERLEQSIQEAGSGASNNPTAVDVHAELLPLAKVWDQFRARHPTSAPAKSKKREVQSTRTSNAASQEKAAGKAKPADKSKVKESPDSKASDKKPSIAQAKSTVTDLQLHKIAVEAFLHGHDTLSITLTRKGDHAELAMQSDEGVLRFIGMVLSKFTKDNLED